MSRDAGRALGILWGLLLMTMSGCASRPRSASAAAASNETAQNASNSAAPDEPASPQSGRFEPAAPVASDATAIAWAEVALQSACSEPPPSGGNASPVRVITTEADFEVAYCRPSSVDWNRFRLAVIPYADILVDITVVPDESQVRVLMLTRPSCEAPWGNRLHLLLPAGNAHVVVVRKTGPPDDCADGYGY